MLKKLFKLLSTVSISLVVIPTLLIGSENEFEKWKLKTLKKMIF